MKLRQLFENIYEENDSGEEFDNSLKTIGVCFGRWNPPHKGHKAVWQHAASNSIWYVGTNQSTAGPKDPLPYDVKLQCMQAVWPKIAGHVIPEQSLLTLASRIYQEHGGNVHLKVYTDEEWLYKALSQYNGVEKEHGMYKFVQIDWVKTERLASATNLRAAVRTGDRKAFYNDMGIKPSVTLDIKGKQLPVFDVVAYYLNQYPEKTKKAVAEAYDHNAPFNAADFNRHMAQLRAREELKKTDPMKALVAGMIDDEREKERLAKRKKPDDDSMSINDPRHPGWSYTEIGQRYHSVDEGEVVKFPKKHKGDITDMHSCPKCGGDLQGGKYMGHQVQVCMPCKQVYLPPNSGIDHNGNKIKDEGVAEGSGGVSVRQWANQVRKDHGNDVKFKNRQEGGGAVDSVIAKNSQGETVGVYNRKTGYPTVYEPKQGMNEADKHSLIGKFKRGEELYNKVKSSFKDIGDAQKAGDSEAASKAFKKHERYANLRAPGTWNKVDEIAGAFPSPSTREKWAKDAAASNAAEAKRLAAKQAQADANRLAVNNTQVARLNQVNYSGANAPKPANATWDGDSDFLELDGTKYAKASRMPIPGGEAPDMKLIVTQEGWQVYVWTRNSLKGVVGRYFYPADKPATINESFEDRADPQVRRHMMKKLMKHHGWELSDLELATDKEIESEYNKLPSIQELHKKLRINEVAMPISEASGYIPKNKKEAKDPRWSNALTKDVTIGAIGKNLKAFRLAEQIAEMERDLKESSQAKISKRKQQSTAGLNTYGDSEHVSGDYTAYRLGMAVAGANGKDPIDMKAKSWIGKKKSTHPYTQEEQDMLKQAYEAVGAEYTDLNNGDMKSKELDSTHKVSPVAAPKRNKYGV